MIRDNVESKNTNYTYFMFFGVSYYTIGYANVQLTKPTYVVKKLNFPFTWECSNEMVCISFSLTRGHQFENRLNKAISLKLL